MHGIIVLVGGFLLDCLLGDPHNPWHPICLIGYLISFLEKKIRKLCFSFIHIYSRSDSASESCEVDTSVSGTCA